MFFLENLNNKKNLRYNINLKKNSYKGKETFILFFKLRDYFLKNNILREI